MGRSGGWVLALGWSGQWLAEFEPAKAGGVKVPHRHGE